MEKLLKKLFGLDCVEAELDQLSADLESAEIGEMVEEFFDQTVEQAAGPMGRWLFK